MLPTAWRGPYSLCWSIPHFSYYILMRVLLHFDNGNHGLWEHAFLVGLGVRDAIHVYF